MTITKITTFFFCLFSTIVFAQPKQKPTPNQIVLSEAISCIGYKVDGGICNEFAKHCLDKSDRNWRKKTHYGKKRLFHWRDERWIYGILVESWDSVKCGDIIGFTDIYIDCYTFFNRHCGIIKEILPNNKFVILDQNSFDRTGKNSKVGEWIFDTTTAVPVNNGYVMIFRPY